MKTANRWWPSLMKARLASIGQPAIRSAAECGSDETATKPWTTIVGIVKDIKSDGLDIDGVPHIYVPTYQDSNKRLSVVLRTSLSATALEPQIRHEIQSIDPSLPVFGVASMNDVLDRSLASRRFSADLVGGFAGLAVLLASIGIYGLLAYMVGQRSREIGIRMALGARPEDIQRMFLRKGVALAGVGVVAGLVFSASSASVMASLLYGVRPHDRGCVSDRTSRFICRCRSRQLPSSAARGEAWTR